MNNQNINPLLSLIILFSYLLIGFIVVQLVVTTMLPTLYGIPLGEMMSLLQNPEPFPEHRVFVLLLQLFTAAGSFILVPFVYCRIYNIEISGLIPEVPQSDISLISAIIFASFLPFVGFLGEINSHLIFPEFLAGFEQWALSTEKQLEVFTLYLLDFSNFGEFILGFIVIAIIPALGEEFVFRGLIQNHLSAFIRNTHVLVIVTGFIFGVFHMQFYGVLPRAFLGMILGYLYHYSGNLWYPIIGHLVNNGISVVLMYMYKQEIISLNIEEMKSIPWYSAVISLVVGVILVLQFKKRTDGDLAEGV